MPPHPVRWSLWGSDTEADRGCHEPCRCCVRARCGFTCPRGCPARPGLDVAAARSEPAPRPRRGRDAHRRVSAPTGAGKTLGVASWAAGPTSPPGLVWLNLARGGADPDRVWRLLRRGLQQAGERAASRRCRRGPAFDPSPDPRPGRARRGAARPRTVDGRARRLPDRARRASSDRSSRSCSTTPVVRFAWSCSASAEPALDLHRFAAAGELVRVSDADLVMDAGEIAGVLRLGDGPATATSVAAVADHTTGWACGVRRAAVALPTTTRPVDGHGGDRPGDRGLPGARGPGRA